MRAGHPRRRRGNLVANVLFKRLQRRDVVGQVILLEHELILVRRDLPEAALQDTHINRDELHLPHQIIQIRSRISRCCVWPGHQPGKRWSRSSNKLLGFVAVELPSKREPNPDQYRYNEPGKRANGSRAGGYAFERRLRAGDCDRNSDDREL